MQAWVFRSEKDPSVYGFATDQDGHALPAEFAPWRAHPASLPWAPNLRPPLSIQPGQMLAGISAGSDAVLRSLQASGFYLFHPNLRVKSTLLDAPPSGP